MPLSICIDKEFILTIFCIIIKYLIEDLFSNAFKIFLSLSSSSFSSPANHYQIHIYVEYGLHWQMGLLFFLGLANYGIALAVGKAIECFCNFEAFGLLKTEVKYSV